MIDPRVRDLCAEFDLEIVSAHRYPMPGQTRATETIRRILDKRGADHARLVLMVFSECRGNHALADEMGLWAVSDLIIAMSDVIEARPSDFLDAMDRIPLGPMMACANELSGKVPQRAALVGMLYGWLRNLRADADRHMRPARARKARISEAEKGYQAAA